MKEVAVVLLAAAVSGRNIKAAVSTHHHVKNKLKKELVVPKADATVCPGK